MEGPNACIRASLRGGLAIHVESQSELDPGFVTGDDKSQATVFAAAKGVDEQGHRCPAVRVAHAAQQDVHGAFASRTQAEALVGGTAQVVAHDARPAAGGDLARMFAKVAFETTPGQQASVFAI